MPPRRHCGRYTVGGNVYFFTEWYDFAQTHLRQRNDGDDLLLKFTNTIQARGCGHMWGDLDLFQETPIERAKEFLQYLEDPEAALTNTIRIFYAACFSSHEIQFDVTQKGHFCLLPVRTKDGDLVCFSNGSQVPYIFRPMKNTKTYENLGRHIFTASCRVWKTA
jgi:hypothetical protein